jgi:hypothetical protein
MMTPPDIISSMMSAVAAMFWQANLKCCFLRGDRGTGECVEHSGCYHRLARQSLHDDDDDDVGALRHSRCRSRVQIHSSRPGRQIWRCPGDVTSYTHGFLCVICVSQWLTIFVDELVLV